MHLLRKLTPFVLCTLFFLGVFNVAHADILSNLVAHWRFDEGMGSTTPDMTGNGNIGTFMNRATWTTGKIGAYAVNLSPFAQQYVAVATPGWSSTNYTITGWIYSTSNQQNYTGIVYSRASTQTPGFGISYGNNGTPVTNQLGYNWSNGTEYQWNSGLIVPNNQWTFVALVASSTGATIYMATSTTMNSAYNGVSESSVTFNGETDIGQDSLGGSRSFTGNIDDVCVYTRALSASDISALYNSSSGCATSNANITTSLFGWWKLDEGSGTTASDSSGGANTGTFGGTTPPTWTSGKIGSYAISNSVGNGGNGGYISTASTTSATHQDMSWSAWVYPTDLTGQSSQNIFLSGSNVDYLTVLTNGDFAYYDRQSNAHEYTGATIPLNTWTFLSATCNDTGGNNDVVTMYINGSQVKQDIGTSGVSSCYDNFANRIYIGGYGASPGNFGFTGKVDEARYYYGRSLSAADMSALYTSSLVGDITSNLLYHYTLDDNTSNTIVVDSKSGSNMSTSFNTSLNHSAGIIGSGGFYMNGGASSISGGPSWSASDSNLSITAWFKSTAGSGGFSLAKTSSGATGVSMITTAAGGLTCSAVDSSFNSLSTSTATTYFDGNWHLFGCVVSGTTIHVYVDGQDVVDATNAAITGNFHPISGGLFVNANNYYIDDLRYYNRALNATDMSFLYTYRTSLNFSPGQWYSYTDDYFMHALSISITGGNSANSFSTSTSFKMAGAANEAVVGTSSSASFQVQTGFMRNLFKGPAPNYTLSHYHWRNDDGSETTATSKTSGVQDTAISSISKLSTNRLRIEISNEGGTLENYSTQQFQLEYGLKISTCAAISIWTSVGSSGDWNTSNSSNLTEGANTTNISTSVGGVTDDNHTFLSTNAGVKDTSSLVSALSVPSDSFVELEYSIQPTSVATDGGTYCFRVTNAGLNSNFTYSQYPQATLASGGTTLTFTVDSSSESFPSVTPGTLAATTTILTVTTNNSSGFNASIQRGDSTGTMSLSGTYIPDKTDWVAPSATTTTGNATASTTQPQTLQFRIRKFGTDTANYASSWWGVDDTTANALFGGISSTSQKIINRSTAANSTTTAFVQYDINVPLSQKNGTYTGSITYTVTANP